MWASAYGQVPTVQLLIQQGAQVDLEGQEGETSLLLAASSGHHEVVRLLLTEGAAVNHADEVLGILFSYVLFIHNLNLSIDLIHRISAITRPGHCPGAPNHLHLGGALSFVNALCLCVRRRNVSNFNHHANAFTLCGRRSSYN